MLSLTDNDQESSSFEDDLQQLPSPASNNENISLNCDKSRQSMKFIHSETSPLQIYTAHCNGSPKSKQQQLRVPISKPKHQRSKSASNGSIKGGKKTKRQLKKEKDEYRRQRNEYKQEIDELRRYLNNKMKLFQELDESKIEEIDSKEIDFRMIIDKLLERSMTTEALEKKYRKEIDELKAENQSFKNEMSQKEKKMTMIIDEMVCIFLFH